VRTVLPDAADPYKNPAATGKAASADLLATKHDSRLSRQHGKTSSSLLFLLKAGDSSRYPERAKLIVHPITGRPLQEVSDGADGTSEIVARPCRRMWLRSVFPRSKGLGGCEFDS